LTLGLDLGSKCGPVNRLKTPSVLFDILNSFVCLARLLNLSHASKELGFTRQTIRRHVAELEEKIGKPLFELDNRKYILTEAGRAALPGAKLLLLNANSWIEGFSKKQDVKNTNSLKKDTDFNFIQKHSISVLNQKGPKLLQQALQKWIEGEGRIDHASLIEMQPHAVNFRKQGTYWVCIHIGDKSSLATWLGEEQALSAAGELINESPITGNYVNDAVEAFDYAYYTGDIVYDHVCARLPHVRGGQHSNVNYHRLVLPCNFPNEQVFIASYVFRTNDIQIGDVPPADVPKMDEKWSMIDGR